MRATVVGSSVAGLTSARILAQHGWQVEVVGWAGKGPYLVLSDLTLGLLADIWGRPGELFAGGHRLTGRSVRWAGGSRAWQVRAPALGLDANDLSSRLVDSLLSEEGARVKMVQEVDALSGPSAWDPASNAWLMDGTGRSGGPRPLVPAAVRTTYGRRCVVSAEVALKPGGASDVTHLAAVPDGWVHLAPAGRHRAVVQAMVPAAPTDPAATLEHLVGQVGSFADIGERLGPVSCFGAAPALTAPVCGPGWMAVGDAACAFDPIAGSGTAHSVQGAVLATAVVRAITAGLPPLDCLSHYRRRLCDAFFDHLRRCARLYAMGFSSPEWQAEVDVMGRAAAASAADMNSRGPSEYRLRGLRLERAPRHPATALETR